MKIAIFTHNYPNTEKDRENAGVFVFDIAQELSKKAEIWIFCPHEKKEKIQKIGRTNVFWFKRGTKEKLGSVSLANPLGLVSLFFFFARAVVNLKKFQKRVKPDVCLAMWAWPSGLFTFLMKIFYQTPYLVWALGSDINVYAKIPIINLLFKQILRKAELLMADGVELSKDTTAFSKKKCLFLPSATKLDPIRLKTKEREKKKMIVLTFLGRMEKVKGPDILVESLILIKDQIENFEVHFGGSGGLLEELKQRVQEEGLSHNLTFYGNISDKKQIAGLLGKSDWVVIPSRSDSIPLVFSEAMRNKAPIISANLSDLNYLIRKYQVGYLFKKENVSQLAKLLVSLKTKTRKKQRKVFVKNTQKAAEDFSVDKSARKLYDYLTQAIND